jgi:5-enolpyruvylshikimate-3-phosphate synthase
MLKKKIIKSSTVSGTIIAPSSKSMMQRAVAANFLAGGGAILNPSDCVMMLLQVLE